MEPTRITGDDGVLAQKLAIAMSERWPPGSLIKPDETFAPDLDYHEARRILRALQLAACVRAVSDDFPT